MYYQKLIFWESQVGYFLGGMVTSPILGTGSLQDADCNLIRATRQWWRLGPAGFCRSLGLLNVICYSPNGRSTTWGIYSFLFL